MKTKINNENDSSEDMLEEYDLDYSKAKSNKYALNFNKSTIKVYDEGKLVKEMKPVLVDVDIIKHFKTSLQINKALRSLIQVKG